jgi:small GTP-binding protein
MGGSIGNTSSLCTAAARYNLRRVSQPEAEPAKHALDRILAPARQELVSELRRLLGELRVLLVRLGSPDEGQKALARAIAQLDELFLLVVVGEFNAGKSALINALLGRRVVEEGVTPTTSRIGLLKHGPVAARSLVGGVYEELTLPLESLLDVSIVDTPGTNAVLREHEALTREFVPRADLVLFVTSADRPFTESERLFLEAIRSWGKKVVVAINKVDFLARRDEVNTVVAFVQERVEALLGFQPEVFPVSARQALLAKRSGDRDVLRASGFSDLEAFLKRTLDGGERIRLKLQNPLGVARRVLGHIEKGVHLRLGMLQANVSSLEQMEAQVKLHREEVAKDLRLRLTDLEKLLQDVERRGHAFVERTLRFGRILELLHPERVAAAFEREVVADLPRAVEKRVEEIADFLAAAELKQWQGIAQKLEGRQALHEPATGKDSGGLEYDRPGLLKDVRPEVQRALDSHSLGDRAEEVGRTAHRRAIATVFLIAAGVLLAGVVLALGSPRTWLPGIPAAAAMVGLALLLLPARRRGTQRALASQMASLGESLLPPLTRRFDQELDRARQRVLESMEPYSSFIRSESERLGRQAQELAALRRPLDMLYERVELMR